MEKDMTLGLVIGYLEYSFDEFYEYLERKCEIAGTEAELIVADLETMVAALKDVGALRGAK